MSDNNKSLRESLELIIKANQEELLDDSFLVKAREAFERATGYKPNKRSILSKAKTFKQFLAGEEPDEKLMKALQEGQTKVKNGITYVVKKTKGGKLVLQRLHRHHVLSSSADLQSVAVNYGNQVIQMIM